MVETLLIFLGFALVTFFTRFAMIAAFGRDLDSVLRRWLRCVPPAMRPRWLYCHCQLPRAGHSSDCQSSSCSWRHRLVGAHATSCGLS
jgi:hypothetical protein